MWIKDRIVEQVDAAMEHFTLMESGEQNTVAFSKVVVESIIHKMDVHNALNMHCYLKEHGELVHIKCTDRIQSVMHYFHAWLSLQLAMRYA